MPDKPELSRRSFVTKASLGAAAAAGALVVTNPFAGHSNAAENASAKSPATMTDPVVAYLTDLKSGTVHLYSGTSGVTVVNHELAQLLARTAAH